MMLHAPEKGGRAQNALFRIVCDSYGQKEEKALDLNRVYT